MVVLGGGNISQWMLAGGGLANPPLPVRTISPTVLSATTSYCQSSTPRLSKRKIRILRKVCNRGNPTTHAELHYMHNTYFVQAQ